jgi:hypothetical protein
MRKSIGLVVLAFAVFMCNCNTAYSWSFTLRNRTANPHPISCDVYGEHLFWRNQVDCSVKDVGPNSEKTCQLPGAICPVALACSYKTLNIGKTYECSTGWWYIGPLCKNLNLLFNQSHNGELTFSLDFLYVVPPGITTSCRWYDTRIPGQ